MPKNFQLVNFNFCKKNSSSFCCLCSRKAVYFWTSRKKLWKFESFPPRIDDKSFIFVRKKTEFLKINANMAQLTPSDLKIEKYSSKKGKNWQEQKVQIFTSFCWLFRIIHKHLYHTFFLPWIYFWTFFQFNTQSSYLDSKLHSTVSSTYKQSRPGVQKPAKMAAGKTLIKTISASSSGTNLYQLLLLLLKEETLEMFPKEDSCAGLSAFTCGFSSTKKLKKNLISKLQVWITKCNANWSII